MITSVGVILFCTIQLFVQARRPDVKEVNIMDMEMRSIGAEGARPAAAIMAIALTIYAVALVLLGVRWSAIILAALIPFMLLSGRRRYVSTVVAVIVVWALIFFVGDQLLAIIWPHGVLAR
jgi:hypothetical protein